MFICCLTLSLFCAYDNGYVNDDYYYPNAIWENLPPLTVASLTGLTDKYRAARNIDELLHMAVSTLTDHNIKRKEIAAAIYKGADVRSKNNISNESLLPEATFHQDIPLVRLLLEHGADINEIDYHGDTAIYKAHTVPLAQLLIDYGALDGLTDYGKQILLAKTIWYNCRPELITLYKSYCIDTITRNNHFLIIPIMNLAMHPQENMIKKAELFLEDLCPEQIKELLALKNNNDKTVFDLIDSQIESSIFFIENLNHPHGHKTIAYCHAYRNFLLKNINGSDEIPNNQKEEDIAQISDSDSEYIAPTAILNELFAIVAIEKKQQTMHSRRYGDLFHDLYKEQTGPKKCSALFHKICLRQSKQKCPLCHGELYS
jgi:hypothetical protein